jgi:hypothetical protein
MRNSMTRISLLSMIGIITISLSSCGVSKVKECNSIGRITKDMKAVGDEIEASAASKNSDTIIKTFLSSSGKVDKLSKEMKALAITDDKLLSLQSQFVKLYQNNSKGLSDVANGLQAKDKRMSDTALAKMVEGEKPEASMIQSLNEYCK